MPFERESGKSIPEWARNLFIDIVDEIPVRECPECMKRDGQYKTVLKDGEELKQCTECDNEVYLEEWVSEVENLSFTAKILRKLVPAIFWKYLCLDLVRVWNINFYDTAGNCNSVAGLTD